MLLLKIKIPLFPSSSWEPGEMLMPNADWLLIESYEMDRRYYDMGRKYHERLVEISHHVMAIHGNEKPINFQQRGFGLLFMFSLAYAEENIQQLIIQAVSGNIQFIVLKSPVNRPVVSGNIQLLFAWFLSG